MSGSVSLTQNVDFNGATLAAGSTLSTATHFQNWMAITLAGTRRVDLTTDIRYTALAQDEQSTEDGNQISMRAAMIGVGAAWKF